MKLRFFNAKVLIVFSAFAAVTMQSTESKAQKDMAEMLRAGASDGSKLVEAYTAPLFKGFGAGLNGGWFNTAKTHKTMGFDLTVSFNAAMIPTGDQSFDANSLGFQNIKIKPGTGPEAPTFAGSKSPANPPVYEIWADDQMNPGSQMLVSEFTSPSGLGLAYSGAPTVQLGLGIYKNTDLMIRYMPTMKLPMGDKADISLYGFGIKHDIKQWIPKMKELPFDLSAYFGYTQMKFGMGLNLTPESGVPNRNGNTATYDNQRVDLKTTATTFGAIISKKLSVLTLYGSVGYTGSSTNLDMTGDYPMTVIETNAGPQYGQKVVDKLTDPVMMDIDGANGVKATAGFRLKLAILTLHADYTLSKYPIASAGIGFAIR